MKKWIGLTALILILACPALILAANTGNTEAMHGQMGAKVSGAPLTQALGGKGLLFGRTKPDFTPPVGWSGEATVENPAVVEKEFPGLKGVNQGDVIQINKVGPGKLKLVHPKNGTSTVISIMD